MNVLIELEDVNIKAGYKKTKTGEIFKVVIECPADLVVAIERIKQKVAEIIGYPDEC